MQKKSLTTFSVYFLGIAVFILIGWFANTAYHLPKSSNNPIAEVRPTPLAKYSIENLAKAYPNIEPASIQPGRILKDDPEFTSYEFSMKFNADLSGSLKTTSGLINIPKASGPHPAVVLFRGYVDPENYFTGVGTARVGEFFAENGFITIAPDFLGYGASDKESENIFETRFQTYVTAITLLKSIQSNQLTNLPINKNEVFIWGHSNGGQIALTTLEITGAEYPTVLWAPVSKPFPYSILYYTDDSPDNGKFLRKKTAEFENDYDSDLFSLTRYLGNIKAPIQLSQGTADDAVPVAWSNLLAEKLEEATVSAQYAKYAGADHNMNPHWSQAIYDALDFFRKHIQ